MTIVIQFKSLEGESTGPPLNVPIETTCEQLNLLLNQLLQAEEPLPYSFMFGNLELHSTISQDLLEKGLVSSEEVAQIIYYPQSIFRVKPATRCSSTLSGHLKEILSVSFNAAGTLLATGSGDTSVRLWDVATETALAEGTGHKNWVLIVAWSPCGRFLASGSMDNQIRLWNGDTGKQVGSPLSGHSGFITSIAWEPLHLANNCSRLASGSKDGSIRIWNVPLRAVEFTLANHTDTVSCLRWSGNGYIFSGSRDRTVKMWNASNGTLVRTLEGHAHWINTMSLSTEHILRIGAFNWEGKITSNNHDVGCTDENLVCGVSFSQAKQVAQTKYDALKGANSCVLERLVTGSDDFSMFLWDPFGSSSKKPVARMTGHQALVNCVVFSPDGVGRWIASASFDKSIKLWNGITGEFVATFRGHVGPVYQVSFSPDSRFLVSGSKDSTVKIWNLRTKALHSNLPGHQDEVYAVDWAPTGDYIATGGKDRTLKIWRH